MAVPKSKITRSKRGQRRAHDRLVAASAQECPNCGELKRPHHICLDCGHYGDREVLTSSDDVDIEDDAA